MSYNKNNSSEKSQKKDNHKSIANDTEKRIKKIPVIRMGGKEPKMEFKFLGFPNQEFKYKGNGRDSSSDHKTDPINGKTPKNNDQKHNLLDDNEDEEEGNPLLKLPFLLPLLRPTDPRVENDRSEELCTEIVDTLRQNNNSLIDEMRELRKTVKESSEKSNKEVITAIKELQTELQKVLIEELPKHLKK